MIKPTAYIDSLTSLRGIAALWVVVFHYSEFLRLSGMPAFPTTGSSMLVGNGYLFVDFFFLLSGFVITHVYAKRLSEGGKENIKKYLWARFTRLYPLHLFSMLLLLAFVVVLSTNFTEYYTKEWAWFFPVFDFFAYLGFAVSFGVVKSYSWNLPAWSIAAEWWTYIAAIVIIPVLHKGFSKQTVLSWVVLLAGLVGLATFGGKHSLDYTLNFGVLRCLLTFSVGVGVYQLYCYLLTRQSFMKSDAALLLAVIATLLLLHFNIYDVLLIPSFALIVLTSGLNTGLPSRILNSKPLRFLGDISYSVYLLQLFWLFVWSSWVDLYWKVENVGVEPTTVQILAWLAVILTCLIASAAVTHRYIEIGCRNILMGRYRKRATSESDAAPDSTA